MRRSVVLNLSFQLVHPGLGCGLFTLYHNFILKRVECHILLVIIQRCYFVECCSAKCHSAECHGAFYTFWISFFMFALLCRLQGQYNKTLYAHKLLMRSTLLNLSLQLVFPG